MFRLSPPTREGLRDGCREMSTFAIAIVVWGLVTGVAMAKSSLTPPQAVGMSLLVFAGSAQLASLPLIAGGFPLWTVLLTGFIVNLRFVIFSAGIQPHLKHLPFVRRTILGFLNGDLPFMLFMRKYPMVNDDPRRIPFFVGMASSNWLMWQAGSLSGIFLAALVPEAWGLGFAGNLALIAVIVPMLEITSARWAAAAAALVALGAFELPYKLNMVLSVVAALAVGVWADSFIASRSMRVRNT